jgi:catechol 2,3-dioxygenase-like lactoylglutathione lyase family enzyme
VLRDAELVAFVGTRDLVVADGFYRGVLGLVPLESSAFSRTYDAHGTTLRVTRVRELRPAGHTVLGWSVADIVAAVAELSAAGVTFTRYDGLEQDARAIWVAPGGTRVAWFADPDGNVLSLSQSAPG